MTSAVISPKVGSIGLGYVRYEYLADGTRVVEVDINATVTELPLMWQLVIKMAEDLDYEQAQLAYSIIERLIEHTRVVSDLVAMMAQVLDEDTTKALTQTPTWTAYLDSRRALEKTKVDVEKFAEILKTTRRRLTQILSVIIMMTPGAHVRHQTHKEKSPASDLALTFHRGKER